MSEKRKSKQMCDTKCGTKKIGPDLYARLESYRDLRLTLVEFEVLIGFLFDPDERPTSFLWSFGGSFPAAPLGSVSIFPPSFSHRSRTFCLRRFLAMSSGVIISSFY